MKSLVVKTAIAAAGVAILLSTATAGANQVWTWRSNVTVWENCLRVDPGNSLAHAALADSLASRGDLKGAAEHRDAQMRLDFDNEEVMRLAAIWASENPEGPPDHALAIRFATRACQLSGWENPQSLQTLATVYSRHGAFLVESGRPGRAVEEYAKALQADPNCQAAMFQLAVILATCNDEKVRRPDEAVRLAERACNLTANPDYRGLAILAVAYAEALQFDAAVAAAEKVVRLARSAGDQAMAADFEKRLGYYRRRVPPQVLRE